MASAVVVIKGGVGSVSRREKTAPQKHLPTIGTPPQTHHPTWQAVDTDQGRQQHDDGTGFERSGPQVVNLLDTLKDLVDVVGHECHCLCVDLLGHSCHGVALAGDGGNERSTHSDTNVEHAKAHALQADTQQPCINEETDGKEPALPLSIVHRSGYRGRGGCVRTHV